MNMFAYTAYDGQTLPTASTVAMPDRAPVKEYTRQPLPRYVSPSEAAEALSVSLSTVYRMIDAGEIDAIRVRSLYRINADSLTPATDR